MGLLKNKFRIEHEHIHIAILNLFKTRQNEIQ